MRPKPILYPTAEPSGSAANYMTTSIRENKAEKERSRGIKGKRIIRKEYTTSQWEFP
jgi:hypothetical protein